MASQMRKDIFELKGEVVEMGNLALEMLNNSMKALSTQDIELTKFTEKKKT